MDETNFYEQILGVHLLWFVADVKLDTAARKVEVFLEHVERETSTCRPKTMTD